MAHITDRVLDLLRVMHAGIPLTVLPKGTAMLDMRRVAAGVRRTTVEQMAADGLIAHDAAGDRYVITEKGRDHVRVRDDVARFTQDINDVAVREVA